MTKINHPFAGRKADYNYAKEQRAAGLTRDGSGDKKSRELGNTIAPQDPQKGRGWAGWSGETGKMRVK